MDNKNDNSITIVVGMSGGVDSSVTALLLKQQGYKVIGLFMHNWEECDDNYVCTATEDYEDVRRICNQIGIPYYSVNFARAYMENVFKYFLEEYKKGRTPNPDVLCNREIKFGHLLDHALMLKASKLATGHYANVEEKNGLYYLVRSADENKDQTYFLNQLSQQQLKYAMFPVGNLKKTELRKIAEENNLITAHKKDSTGICFIGERNFKKFLSTYLPASSGKILDENNVQVGTHDGVMFYTTGQRRGLNIGGRNDCNARWFVYKKDVKNNILYVTHGNEDVLLSHGLKSYKFNFIPAKPSQSTFECLARFRHRQPLQKVWVTVSGDGIDVKFHQRQRAVTEGQYVVLYDGKYCLGGGIIDEVLI